MKQVTRQMAAKANVELPFSALMEYYYTMRTPIPYRYSFNFLGASRNFELLTISILYASILVFFFYVTYLLHASCRIRPPQKSSTFPCLLLQFFPPPMIANLHLFFPLALCVSRSFSFFPFFSSLPVPMSLQCCNHPSGHFSECGRSSSICAALPPYSKASCLPSLVTLEW